MPRLLKDLLIREVSSVDRGAGEGVKILLMKRLADDPVAKAHRAFEVVVKSIMDDATITDKTAAIDETRKELTDHLAQLAKTNPENDDMNAKTPAELQKALDEATARETKLKADLAFASMSDTHKSYATECKLEGDHLTAFVGKTAEQRDAFIKEFPPKKKKPGAADEEDCEKSAIEKAVNKALEPILAQNTELKKQVGDLTAERTTVEFKKRAVAMGLVEADGELLQKAYGGDAEAQKKFDEKIKALTTQVQKGALLGEFGGRGGVGAGASAYDQLMQKAAELVSKGGDKPLSQAQAFTKVYEDPANRELVAQHKRDEAAARQRVAA